MWKKLIFLENESSENKHNVIMEWVKLHNTMELLCCIIITHSNHQSNLDKISHPDLYSVCSFSFWYKNTSVKILVWLAFISLIGITVSETSCFYFWTFVLSFRDFWKIGSLHWDTFLSSLYILACVHVLLNIHEFISCAASEISGRGEDSDLCGESGQ